MVVHRTIPVNTCETLDVAIIGAGAVGLAVARELALAGRDVVVLESEGRIGVHTSSRNSEVIHAGIYYPPGTLKARLCVEGKHALYAYCHDREVSYARLGKLIVATEHDQIPALERLKLRAEENGVRDLEFLSAEEVRELEPAVSCVRGLLSPSTGIVDSHGFMNALRADAERAGASIVFAAPVLGGEVCDDGIRLEVGGVEPVKILCRTIVNSAGLFAQSVARSIRGFPSEHVPEQYFAKGHYFVMQGRSPFSRLVYPVPVPGGLGIHVTLDLAGQARFGPDVAWLDRPDYGFEESRAGAFYAAIRRYFPGLPDGSLAPGYTGIRPKLVPAGEPASDFVVMGPEDHRIPGLVHLFGIESPGLTCSLALAAHVRTLLGT